MKYGKSVKIKNKGTGKVITIKKPNPLRNAKKYA